MTRITKYGWIAAMLLLCCCAIAPRVTKADPPTPPTSPSEVDLPADNKKAVPQSTSNGWTKITPSTGTTHTGKSAKAKKIKVAMKKKADGEMPPEKIVIKKIGYYKKNTNPAEYVEADVTSIGSENGKAANIDIPADADTSKAIYVKVYTENAQTGAEVIPAVCPLNKNFTWHDDGGVEIVSVEHGGGAVCSIDGEDDTTLLELAGGVLDLSAEDYTEPDLMFWCTDLIETGVLLFCPIGEFEFGSVPDEILAFDIEGADLINAGMIELGDAYLTPRGDVAIPVGSVNAELPAFGMIVRGVAVGMNSGANANSVHCYTTGGSSLRRLEGDVCPIAQGTRVLDNWELLSWSANYGLGSVVAPIGEEESVIIDNGIVTTVSGETNSGYLDGIIIEANEANQIKNGKIILRAVSGWQFELDDGSPDTKVYLLNADTGADLYQEELSASVRLSSHGDLVVTLHNIETYCAEVRVKVVITGAKAAYTAPVPWGVGYKLECYGPALRAPLRNPRVMLEGEDPEIQEVQSGSLPQEPIEVTDWTPVATSE